MDDFAQIDPAPFPGVLLLLAIVFAVFPALIRPAGFNYAWPHCGVPFSGAPRPEFTVVVDRRGRLFIGKRRISQATLYSAIANAHNRNLRAVATVTADDKTPYGQILRIIDAARDAGIVDVRFITA